MFSLVIAFNIRYDFYGVIFGNMETQLTGPSERFLKIKHLIENPKKYNSYFMGSSRVGKIDTRNIIDDNSWYNLAYPEGVPFEHLSDIKLLLKKGVTIKNLNIGLDNISYLVAPETHLNKLIFRAYDESCSTIFDFLIAKPSLSKIKTIYKAEKMVDKVDYDIYNSGLQILLNKDKWIDSNIESHINNQKFSSPTWAGNYYNRTTKTIDEISEIVKLCKYNNIKLKLFINPMHSTTYLKLDIDEYLTFLKLLVKQNSFYDFSGINQITINNFNYYETSHYRPFIGEMIKSVIFEKANTNFNYLVTLENIDSISKVKKNDFKKTQNRIR
jgi:hypothetical protein